MATKRALRRRSCARKFRYRTKGEANSDVARLIKSALDSGRASHIKAYACRFCGGWHIGHYRGG